MYDVTCIDISAKEDATSFSPRVMIGQPTMPVHHYFELSMKPSRIIPFALRSKVAMVYNDGGKTESGRAAMPATQGWYTSSVRALGEYRLVPDTTAPIVKPISKVEGNLSKARSIVFKATDDITSVKTFKAELDGKWLLFEQHEDEWKYVFDSHCSGGKHTLVVTSQDENGNESKASYTFTR
jgi:hypothetical protein